MKMDLSTFPQPQDNRYFEDYVPGRTYEFGTVSAGQEEIMEFAKRYDPQAMHTDLESAARGPFGGLIASGWHTAGMMMRLFADNFLSKNAGMASPGVDEIRWMRPVRPADILHIRVTILETTRSRSKPDRGIVRTMVETLNQNGEVVMTMKAMNLVRGREQTS
jgi:acyl dehydratase